MDKLITEYITEKFAKQLYPELLMRTKIAYDDKLKAHAAEDDSDGVSTVPIPTMGDALIEGGAATASASRIYYRAMYGDPSDPMRYTVIGEGTGEVTPDPYEGLVRRKPRERKLTKKEQEEADAFWVA